MRVLWFTHMVLPDLSAALNRPVSPRGGWMPALADALVNQENLELAIATPLDISSPKELDIKGIRYYAIPCRKKSLQRSELNPALIDAYKKVVDKFQPDVIHIHGTEYFEGLLTARQYITCPTVISIQGIIDVCRHHYFGGISLRSVFTMRTLRDWIRCDGLIEQKIKWGYRAIREREIFAGNHAFIGRTRWDKAHVKRLSPKARYYHCDEMLRTPFYHKTWNIDDVNRYSIFASSAGYPIKGFHILIKAVALLRNEFPDIAVKTPLASFCNQSKGLKSIPHRLKSTGYTSYLTGLIAKYSLESNFIPLSAIDGDQMAAEFAQSHVFVLPSLIENSPNSLAEAMLIGTPSVVSYTGGTASMAKDGNSALFFPPGDEAVLAEQLRKIFTDDELAITLSASARQTAIRRHDKKKIVNDTIEIYQKEIQASGL